MEQMSKKMLPFVSIMVLLVSGTYVSAEDGHASVIVNAPEHVSGTFDVTVDIDDVTDLTSGQFDLTFDPDVLSVTEVKSGNIGGTEVKKDMEVIKDDKVKVIFNLPNAGLVSGSGYLATITFEVVGNVGDNSALELSNGLLTTYESSDHPSTAGNAENVGGMVADWSGDVVTVTSGDASTATAATAVTATPVQIVTATPGQSQSQFRSSGPDPGLATASAESVTSTPAAEDTTDADAAVLAERFGIVPHNFNVVYLLIGLLAFIYTLITLR
ncbi:MAG: hypothetical protein C5S47_04340 [Candidatus Methanogasteraceae archaeon]|nr:MAG: hypothetical protein C5S47_04340 [ANME-2 cluster archaeon]